MPCVTCRRARALRSNTAVRWRWRRRGDWGATAPWSGVVKGAKGEPLAVGRRTRAVPPAIRRALRVRDGGCRFPGCGRSRYVHAHHIRHWADGGETNLDNLVTLCSLHHRKVHEGGYGVRVRDGAIEFTRPDGRVILPAGPSAGRTHGGCFRGSISAKPGDGGAKPGDGGAKPGDGGCLAFNRREVWPSTPTPRVADGGASAWTTTSRSTGCAGRRGSRGREKCNRHLNPMPADILPTAQRQLWPRLAELPNHFLGGTGLALQLGHRESVDFDFFSSRPIDPDRLAGTSDIFGCKCAAVQRRQSEKDVIDICARTAPACRAVTASTLRVPLTEQFNPYALRALACRQ